MSDYTRDIKRIQHDLEDLRGEVETETQKIRVERAIKLLSEVEREALRGDLE